MGTGEIGIYAHAQEIVESRAFALVRDTSEWMQSHVAAPVVDVGIEAIVRIADIVDYFVAAVPAKRS